MITNDEARARVQRGAAHLDVVRPGWFNRIDVGTLTLHDPCGCIVGQLVPAPNKFPVFESFQLTALGLVPHDIDTADMSEAEYFAAIAGRGFDLGGADVRWATLREKRDRIGAYKPLQDAWIEAIADRRLSTTPNPTPDDDAVPVRPTVEVNVCSRR